MLIEQTVLPLQEKAIESARKALELAHNNRIYNDWSKRSAKLLSQLSPESFPILNDEVVNTEWEVPATFSTQYISEPAGQLGMMIREAQAEEESKETKDDKKKAKKTEESSDSKADDTKKGQSDQAKEQGEGAQSKKENK
jgi:hypothetical protein